MKRKTKNKIKQSLLMLVAVLPFLLTTFFYRLFFLNLQQRISILYGAINSFVYVFAIIWVTWRFDKFKKAFK